MSENKNYIYKLQKKWKLNSLFQLIIVLIVFALGGSTCAFLGGHIMPILGFEHKGIVYGLTYFIIVTILWPCCIIFYSLIFGQYPFFKNYIINIGKHII